MSIWVHYIVVRLDDHTFVLEKLVFLYFLPLLKTSRKRCRFCRCQFEWLRPFCAEFVITQDGETRAHLTKNIWSNPAFRNYYQFILVSRRTICSLAPADQKSKSRSWAQRVDYYSHLITCFNIGVTIHFVVTDICRGCYVLIPGTCPSSNERRLVFLVLTFLVSGFWFNISGFNSCHHSLAETNICRGCHLLIPGTCLSSNEHRLAAVQTRSLKLWSGFPPLLLSSAAFELWLSKFSLVSHYFNHHLLFVQCYLAIMQTRSLQHWSQFPPA